MAELIRENAIYVCSVYAEHIFVENVHVNVQACSMLHGRIKGTDSAIIPLLHCFQCNIIIYSILRGRIKGEKCALFSI